MPPDFGSKGVLRGHITGNCDDFGIDEGSVSLVIRTYMALTTEVPVHWIDMGAGVLLFAQTQPNDPTSGVIYVYDKKARDFWSLQFDDGKFPNGPRFVTRVEFEALAEEYNLNDYAAQPALLKRLAGPDGA